jgi:hypothetical protein
MYIMAKNTDNTPQAALNWSPKNGRHEVWKFDLVENV